MKNLIKLQLKKSFLSFAVILAAILFSVPLALWVKAAAMTPREAINLAMLYWAAAGIPLVVLILSGIAGAEAAKEQARTTEQPLPVSQYGLLLSSLAAVLLELGVLILAVYAILGFNLPLETLSKIQEEILRLYIFAMVYLTLYGFVFSYAFGNGIAGAMTGAAAVAFTLYPFVTMSVFQQLAFELVPMLFIKPAVSAAALAGGALALKLLSGVNDRKAAWTASKLTAVVMLLAAAPLASFASLAWLNLKARNVTLPVTRMFASPYAVDKHLYASRDIKEASRLLLVQRPFYGDAFFIDKEGNRSMIDAGRKIPGPGLSYLFPDLTFANAESVFAPSGVRYLLYMPQAGGNRIMQGNAKTGFAFRAAVKNGWSMDLLGGKEPGILHRRDDGYYYSPLTPEKAGLNWRQISTIKEGYLTFLGEKYRREGTAAVFRKDGKTLEYRGRRWTIPGAAGTRLPVPGIELADGMNFIVPAEINKKAVTYLCRPNGKAELIWPEYFRLTQNLSLTPDGAVWGVGIKSLQSYGSPAVKIINPEFYILTAEGTPLSAVNTRGIMERTGVTNGEIRLLKAGGGYLWFNADNRYMVRAGIKNMEDLKIWRLPAVPRKRGYYYARAGAVSPSPDGIFVAATDGVYFMDWEGSSKKIY
ncbi:MAG: hypothetical protein PHV36_07920 [Elusimicrobiales bacterium]|nr:hypothetical protein [Elusimicrobiales bacterium]